MRRFIPVLLLLTSIAVHAADDYVPGPDSKKQPGVPEGEVLKFSFENSKIDMPQLRNSVFAHRCFQLLLG